MLTLNNAEIPLILDNLLLIFGFLSFNRDMLIPLSIPWHKHFMANLWRTKHRMQDLKGFGFVTLFMVPSVCLFLKSNFFVDKS
jgi:hypothetical protein